MGSRTSKRQRCRLSYYPFLFNGLTSLILIHRIMTSKKIKTLKALKSRLRKTLPEKISEVIDSYENFSEQPVPDDAKGFSAHHSACKSAVIHAETLLKLAEWTDEKTQGDKSADGDRQILELLNEARNELNGDDEN